MPRRTFGQNFEKKRKEEGRIVDQTEVRYVTSVTRNPSLALVPCLMPRGELHPIPSEWLRGRPLTHHMLFL